MLEELYEKIKKYTEEKTGVESTTIEANEILERIKRIDDGESSRAFIYVSDNGQSVNGATPDIMGLLSILVQKLNENGMDKELIKKSVEIGLATKEEKLAMLKDQIERITKYIKEEK